MIMRKNPMREEFKKRWKQGIVLRRYYFLETGSRYVLKFFRNNEHIPVEISDGAVYQGELTAYKTADQLRTLRQMKIYSTELGNFDSDWLDRELRKFKT